MPWLLLIALGLVGVAVLAVRTMARPTSAEPTPNPAVRVTNTPLAQQRTAEPAAAPLATPRSTAAPTLVATRPTAVPTRANTQLPVQTLTVRPATPVVATSPAAATVAPTRPPAATAPGTLGSVALTFDAGADRGYAEDILDILQQEHVVASFGVTGNWARANPDLVRRMAGDGHLVINHSLDHRSFTGLSDSRGGLSAAARRTELEEADAIIAPLIGHSTRPEYRLPYGDDDARVAADVQPAGYTHKVGWTVDSLGWRGVSSADILARCVRLAAPGAVYVFHVGRASQDAIALPQLIQALRDKGFGFQRVD